MLMIASRVLMSSLVMTFCGCICFCEGKVCYPPHWGGIVPGITEDRDLVALYGKGLFSDQLGHTGGRYYTDKNRSSTLIVGLGVDRIVESVEIRTELTPPVGSLPKELGVSPRFDPDSGFGYRHELHLDSSKDQVRSNLGQPHLILRSDGEVETWQYETDYGNTECYPAAYLEIRFSKDRMVSALFYNGD